MTRAHTDFFHETDPHQPTIDFQSVSSFVLAAESLQLVKFHISLNHQAMPRILPTRKASARGEGPYDRAQESAGANHQNQVAAAVAVESPTEIVVHEHDVLNGRGVNLAHHPGNQRFRSLIQSRSDPNYCASYSLNEKKALAEDVVNHIESLDPPGRFLKRCGKTKNRRGSQAPWELMKREEAIKKARQALRDCNRPDRVGYAKSVAAPVDVVRSTIDRKNTGMSQQQYAQQLAASNPSTASVASSARSSGRRTPSSVASGRSSSGGNKHSPVPSPRQTRRPAETIMAPWVDTNTVTRDSEDLKQKHDALQDTPSLMHSTATPPTVASSGDLFSDPFYVASNQHGHSLVDVSHAPGVDSPHVDPVSMSQFVRHDLSGSPNAATFEEALATIHVGDEDVKPHAVASFTHGMVEHFEDADAVALSSAFDGEEDFAAAFGEGDHL